MADVIEALVHHVGIATVWVRVQAAGTKKGHWEDPCTECAPIVQRIYKRHWKISMYAEKREKKKKKKKCLGFFQGAHAYLEIQNDTFP